MKAMYYHRDGTPYEGTPDDPQGTLAWAKDFENRKDRRIGLDKVNGYRISTVWLGLDHSFMNGKPLIFETMVFKGDSYAELDMERYSTEQEAKEGHLRMVEKYKDIKGE